AFSTRIMRCGSGGICRRTATSPTGARRCRARRRRCCCRRTGRAVRAGARRGLCRREGVTLFMALQAALAVVLARWSGQSDLLLGTPVANRTRQEVEGLIGFFVNTLVLRTRLEAGLRVRDLLRQVRETALAAYAHQELPFEQLVEALQPV